jgi:hercynine metabolism protein
MTWLDQLEQELDQRLSSFLRSNPVQVRLFEEQHQRDRVLALQRQRQQLIEEASEQRRQLLALAENIKAWTERSDRAKAAGASDLARRAELHRAELMNQGHELWRDLASLGRRFDEVDAQLLELKHQRSNRSNLDQDWALFEAEQELEELRHQAGLS